MAEPNPINGFPGPPHVPGTLMEFTIFTEFGPTVHCYLDPLVIASVHDGSRGHYQVATITTRGGQSFVVLDSSRRVSQRISAARVAEMAAQREPKE